MIADYFAATEADAVLYGASLLTLEPKARRERYHAAEWKSTSPLAIPLLWATIEQDAYDIDRHQLDLVQSENNEEAWLFRFPEPLVVALSASTDDGVQSSAVAWVKSEELNGWSVKDAQRLIGDLRRLAREAIADNKQVYLWTSL